jgi:hypothetical protein
MNLTDYNLMVEKHLRVMVRDVIAKIQFTGLEKDKNYYVISLISNHEGVLIPEHIKEKYPKELIIIIQNQFLIKEVSDKYFIINLAFSGKHYDLTIPFDSISMFYDPYAEFMLKFLEYSKKSDEQKITKQKIDKSEIEKKLVSISDFKNKTDK